MAAISRDIEIVTDRLKLRAASMADVDLVWSATRVVGFNDWMTWDAPESRDELEDIARKNEQEWAADNSYTFTVELLSNGQGIGRLGIMREDSPDTWNIGYWIHPDYWGQGYATEAARALIELGKSDLSAHEITTAHAIANRASQKVIEKLGFIRTGENPCGFTKRGEPVPEYEYAIIFKAH